MIPALLGAAALGGFLAWVKSQDMLVEIPVSEHEPVGLGLKAVRGAALYTWGLTGRSE
ncbi:MAG: hypothetical protein JW722_02030 [Demequinaceae bacterium]|nr:hypothetical protein [Demequinaceae bacterium]